MTENLTMQVGESISATYFHDKLKSNEKTSYICLPYDLNAIHKEFHSEYAAKQALKEYLREPYDAASSLVNPQNIQCVARTLAEEYSKIICDCFEPIKDNLKMLFEQQNRNDLYETVKLLVSDSKKTLQEKFIEEISDEYYKMYDFNYFVNKVTIEEHDYRTSEGVWRILESLFPDSMEYTYDDFIGAVREMEKDINDRVKLFYRFAHKEYLNYIKEIVRFLENPE